MNEGRQLGVLIAGLFGAGDRFDGGRTAAVRLEQVGTGADEAPVGLDAGHRGACAASPLPCRQLALLPACPPALAPPVAVTPPAPPAPTVPPVLAPPVLVPPVPVPPVPVPPVPVPPVPPLAAGEPPVLAWPPVATVPPAPPVGEPVGDDEHCHMRAAKGEQNQAKPRGGPWSLPSRWA